MTQQEDIPGPAAHVLVLRIVHLRPISKLIAVLVSPFRQLVIERDRINTKLRQGVQLRWLGDAVVIGILPKSQFGEDCIVRVDDGVSIAAIYGLIELVQCQKTISLYIGSRRLVRSAAEQLATIVYRSIAVTIQHQESVVAADCGPRETIGSAVVIEIEIHAVRETRQVISIPCNVNDDWRLVTVVTLAVRKDPLAIRTVIPESPLIVRTTRVDTVLPANGVRKTRVPKPSEVHAIGLVCSWVGPTRAIWVRGSSPFLANVRRYRWTAEPHFITRIRIVGNKGRGLL